MVTRQIADFALIVCTFKFMFSLHARRIIELFERKKEKIEENKTNGIKLKLEHQIHILFAFVGETKQERKKILFHIAYLPVLHCENKSVSF